MAKFTGNGTGIVHGQNPVCVKLPADIDAIVKALPDRSAFIRQAIVEKLQREGLLPD